MRPSPFRAVFLPPCFLAASLWTAASGARTLAPADALLAGRADAAAAAAYEALGPQAAPKREGWRQNNWGLALLRLGKSARAVEHFRAAVRADPLNFIARANLGAAYEQVGDLTKALAVDRRALELLRDQNRGLKAGRPQPETVQEAGENLAAPALAAPAARALVERPCALDAVRLRTALARAAALVTEGRYAEARSAYAAVGVIASPAKEGWRLNNWGLCSLRLDLPVEARERLERSVAVYPGNPVAWTNLAVACEQLGLEAEAEDAFARGSRGAYGADPQRLQLAKVKLDLALERRRWEALRR